MEATSATPRTTTGTFERRATGLVREASTLDVLIYNTNFVSLGLMTALVFLFSLAFYPGANVYVTALLTLAFVLPTSLVFAALAGAMPRSGGDYVYVSRILHPALGMMSSFNNTVWWIVYGGVPSAFFALFGVGPFFSTVGQLGGVDWMMDFGNWAIGEVGTFVIGSVLIIVLVAIFIRGLGVYFRLQNLLFFISLIAFACTMGVWLFKSGGDLRTGLEANLGANLFSNLDKSSAEAGFANGGPFSLKWTILAGTWVYINLVFNQSSAYIGGEVKRASRVQLWAMPAVAVGSVAVLLVMLALADNALGLTTFGQLAASQGLVFTQIAAFGSDSTLIAVLILGTFIFASYTWLPGQITNASRNLLAYSIDGIVPRFMGTVHKRYHTPWVALLIMGVGSIGALAAYVWVPDFATLVGIFGFILGFMIVSVAAIAFPYRLPDVFESSPLNGRISGIPWISIIGVVSLASLGVMAWAFLTDPSAGLNGKPGLIAMNVGIWLSGFVLYFVAMFIQRRRGVDISKRFREIPVE
jgi:basic amino acid/polyamine antiporter, APA family